MAHLEAEPSAAAGRRLIQENIPGAEVLEAGSLIQAFPRMRRVDLLLMDVDVSRLRSLDILKAACKAISSTRFAAISAPDSRADIPGSLAAGFQRFISKRESDEEIVAAIKEVPTGRIFVAASLAKPGALDLVPGEAPPVITTDGDVSRLTPRQREVLALLARGMSNKEIARVLRLAEAATKFHIATLPYRRCLRARGGERSKRHMVDALETAGAFGVSVNPPVWNSESLKATAALHCVHARPVRDRPLLKPLRRTEWVRS